MKSLVLSMLAIASISVLSSCSSESDVIDEVIGGNQDKVEIKLNAGIGEITTKAPIEPNFTSDLTVYFFKPADAADAASADWTNGTVLSATLTSSDNKISFGDKPQYYNTNGNLSFLAGCYIDNAKTTTSAIATDLATGTLQLEIDGTQDIMATDGQNGSKVSSFSSFTFNHQLAQLEFVVAPKVEADAETIKELFGKVTKIELKNQVKALELKLQNSTPSLDKQADAAEDVTFTVSPTEGIDIANNAVFGQALIYPETTLGQTSKLINLTVYTQKGPEKGYSVTAKIGEGNVALTKSNKYTITINFSKSEISAEGSVGAWNNGGSGSAEDIK